MSGPKSSRYTLTAAQRRALAEQLERERQLRIQAERDERQRNENFSLYSDVDALVKQNNRLIDDANQVQRETEMKVVSAGNVQSTTKLLGERAKAICNQIRNVQGNELLEQKQSLIEIKSTLRTLCIRFDMSEYGQPQSDQKLLGAPPGYVGYEAGGQLTNAVRNNPFSILLFDEIEKAHPSVMDKFLQILEDGRMTDGQGNTVYFSETIIIFTSNLGIYTMDQYGQRHANVTPDMTYDEVQRKVRQGIEEYFKLQLGRPEILNRIGENIVVFDFIREPVAEQILDSQISKITKNLSLEKNIELEISQSAHEALKQASIGNLANGGRGIGNIVESMLINPLSRFMFDNSVFSNSKITITGIDTAASPYSLNCTVEPRNN